MCVGVRARVHARYFSLNVRVYGLSIIWFIIMFNNIFSPFDMDETIRLGD